MSFTDILSFFDQSVPIGVVALLIYMAVMGRDVKHINKSLDNHVTDTNKKIDDLKKDLGSQINRIEEKLDRLIERQK